MDIKQQFKNVFANEAEHVYFAPGRVNLIGEHVDYNGGMVLPCALTIGTYGVVCLRDDEKIRIYSENFKESGIIHLHIGSKELENGYYDYIIAMLALLEEKGHKVEKGFDLYLYGNIPNGSGLSSSASLTVLLGYLLNDLFKFGLTKVDLAKLGQACEHYVGVNCGIMDHFASSLGDDGKAIYLNTNTLEYSYVPVDFKEYQLLVVNTNKKRKLTDSKYNERRAECDKSLEILKGHYDIKELCDLKVSDLEKVEEILNDDVLFRRVKHAVSENDRVLKFSKALQEGDLLQAGKYLSKSHESLRYDYEVTGLELDTIVDSFMVQKGTIGARMVGAGFGGCAIALVHKDKVENVVKYASKLYESIVGYELTVYYVELGTGVHKIS